MTTSTLHDDASNAGELHDAYEAITDTEKMDLGVTWRMTGSVDKTGYDHIFAWSARSDRDMSVDVNQASDGLLSPASGYRLHGDCYEMIIVRFLFHTYECNELFSQRPQSWSSGASSIRL